MPTLKLDPWAWSTMNLDIVLNWWSKGKQSLWMTGQLTSQWRTTCIKAFKVWKVLVEVTLLIFPHYFQVFTTIRYSSTTIFFFLILSWSFTGKLPSSSESCYASSRFATSFHTPQSFSIFILTNRMLHGCTIRSYRVSFFYNISTLANLLYFLVFLQQQWHNVFSFLTESIGK